MSPSFSIAAAPPVLDVVIFGVGIRIVTSLTSIRSAIARVRIEIVSLSSLFVLPPRATSFLVI